MDVKFKIDRHFLFLHADNLLVFAERVLKHNKNNPNIPKNVEACTGIESGIRTLRLTIDDIFIKRKDRLTKIREKEVLLLHEIEKLALHVEGCAKFKSDAISSGFHLHSDHPSKETRRKVRMSAKLAILDSLEKQ